MQEKRLAIVKNPSVYRDDHSGKLCLWFHACTNERVFSFQSVELPELPAIPGLAYDVSKLANRPCWIQYDDDAHLYKFAGWWQP